MTTPKTDDKLDFAVEVQDVPPLDSTLSEAEYADDEVDHGYLSAPKWTKMYRSVFFQMIIFGFLAFVGPAMTDAINLLGGGGLKSPYLANLATSLNYAGSCVMAFFGGPVINKIGIKWACVISSTCYVLNGTGYYAQARFGIQGYLLASRVIAGFTNALLYVGESTAMLSYPEADKRGKYLGIWVAMRNSGTIAGGAINFGNNSKDTSSGGVAWSTYLIFIGFEASGGLISWLLSQTKKVRRYDGTRVPMSPNVSWLSELKALMLHLKSPRTLLMFFPAFYSFFYGGTYNTYLALHFSVRSRALSSLITPICTVVTVLLYGLLLDTPRFTQKTRAWIGLSVWLVPQVACFIWTGVNYGRWGVGTKTETYYIYDYGRDGAAWAAAYLPYLIVYISGFWCQMNLYWILGTFSTDVKASSRTGGLFRAFESAGSAVTYAINSNSKDKRIPLYVNCAILVLTIPCMVGLIRNVPEKPQDFDDVVDAAPVKAAAEKAVAQEQL